jgi:hypothetical protein
MPEAVSVVIPTIGRPSLRTAVESCLAQTTTPLEVIVVCDGVDAAHRAHDVLSAVETPLVRLVISDPPRGAARSRNLGTSEARGKYVAYLDDDDHWAPLKLECQLQVIARESGRRPPACFITCRTTFVRPRLPWARATYPTRPLPSVADLGRYLVTRDCLFFGSRMIQSSSLLIDADIARTVGWDEDLPKHQDWDFIIRAGAAAGSVLTAGKEPLVTVHQASAGSVSRIASWRHSLMFLEKHSTISGRAKTDFMLVHVYSAAIAAGGIPELRRSLEETGLPRTRPHAAAVAVLTRSLVQRLR